MSRFGEADLVCGWSRCVDAPRLTIVSVGLSFADQPCWRIVGACRRHAERLERMAAAESVDLPGAGPHHLPADLPTVLQRLESDEFMQLDCYSVAAPTAYTEPDQLEGRE